MNCGDTAAKINFFLIKKRYKQQMKKEQINNRLNNRRDTLTDYSTQFVGFL